LKILIEFSTVVKKSILQYLKVVETGTLENLKVSEIPETDKVFL
jgi:hypothetical protein